MGTAYFEIGPEWGTLKGEMLRHSEEHLSTEREGVRRLRIYINDEDGGFRREVSQRGYIRCDDSEPMSQLPIDGRLPAASLPSGFRLRSLAENNDLRQVDRVLWRGFDHGDEPPTDGIEDRKFMQSAPNYSRELNIVVEAPDGSFASYCGMWYESEHSIAYVEPVATDPDFRRMGLARAAVTEGIRRCGAMGARVAYVGSTMPIYLSMGFQRAYGSTAWHREWR
jgi:ribosomal protein S18 acetylase RimI-like enzyme